MGNKISFTLAEILTVLVLLGIVAAIIVPSTIQNTQQKHFLTKYKKAYSALDAAFSQWEIETNFEHSHLGGNVATSMENMLHERLQTQNVNIPVIENNFIAGYNNGKGIKALDGGAVGGMNVWRQGGVVMRDGTQINLSCGHAHWVNFEFVANHVGQYSCSFFVDVNGESNGPNVLGKDIFYLIGLHDGIYAYPLPETYKYLYIPPGSNYNSARSERNITCNKRTSSGYGCSSWFLTHSDYQK